MNLNNEFTKSHSCLTKSLYFSVKQECGWDSSLKHFSFAERPECFLDTPLPNVHCIRYRFFYFFLEKKKKYLYCLLLYMFLLSYFMGVVCFDFPIVAHTVALIWFQQLSLRSSFQQSNCLCWNCWRLNVVFVEPVPSNAFGEITGCQDVQGFYQYAFRSTHIVGHLQHALTQ